MDNLAENKKSYRHIIYAGISLACPFIAFALISIYQEYTYEWYWDIGEHGNPLDDSDVNAGAMMAIVLVVQLIMAIGAGSIVGLLFATLSLKRRLQFLSFGTAALLFNLAPILFTLAFLIRGYIYGI